jgi:hypothetical protein
VNKRKHPQRRMKDLLFWQRVEQIEQEGNDDFLMILSFGAQCYDVKELHQLLRQLEQKTREFAYYQRVLLLLASTIAVWIGLSFLFQYLQFSLGTYIILLVPVSALVSGIGFALLNRKYRSIKHAHQIERIIVEELDRRRKDASIF